MEEIPVGSHRNAALTPRGRAQIVHVGRQFALGVVQTAQGLPIGHEIFEGNVAETRTLAPVVYRALRERLKAAGSTHSPEDLLRSLRQIQRERYRHLYNHDIPRRALNWRTPIQDKKDWQPTHPELFIRHVRNHAGPNRQAGVICMPTFYNDESLPSPVFPGSHVVSDDHYIFVSGLTVVDIPVGAKSLGDVAAVTRRSRSRSWPSGAAARKTLKAATQFAHPKDTLNLSRRAGYEYHDHGAGYCQFFGHASGLPAR